jgi:hypothetical protein
MASKTKMLSFWTPAGSSPTLIFMVGLLGKLNSIQLIFLHEKCHFMYMTYAFKWALQTQGSPSLPGARLGDALVYPNGIVMRWEQFNKGTAWIDMQWLWMCYNLAWFPFMWVKLACGDDRSKVKWSSRFFHVAWCVPCLVLYARYLVMTYMRIKQCGSMNH